MFKELNSALFELATEKAHSKTDPFNSNSLAHILQSLLFFLVLLLVLLAVNAHLNILLLWDTEKVLMSKSQWIRYALELALEKVRT